MNNFDFNSKKYVILLAVVCIGFLILTIKAFEYLPERLSTVQTTQQESVNNDNESAEESDNTNSETTSQKDKEGSDDGRKSGHIDFEPNIYSTEPAFEEIEAPKGAIKEDIPEESNEKNVLSPDDEAVKHYLSGKKYIESKDYASALSELKLVAELTKDKEINAMAYESIAEIYMYNKRYGTALTFADKAYYLSPSSSREMLIARIYYKSGNTENAITKMNNILKKGL